MKGKKTRRARIIREAQKTLLNGPTALNYRELAEAAEVTVPTIYNLIGNKQQLLKALCDAVLDTLEEDLDEAESGNSTDAVVGPAQTLLRLVSQDPAALRASIIAFDELGRSSERSPFLEIRDRRRDLEMRAMNSLVARDVLRGEVPAEVVSSLLSQCFRQNCRDWAFKLVSARQVRHDLLLGTYGILLIDATPQYRSEIIELMGEL